MIGYKGKVYHQSALSAQADENGWTEGTKVRDVTVNLSATDIEAMDRATDWEQIEVGKLKCTVTLQLKHDPTAALQSALYTAFTTRAKVALAFIDGSGDIDDGGKGIAGNWYVTEFPEAQPLEGIMVRDVTVRPADAAYMAFIT